MSNTLIYTITCTFHQPSPELIERWLGWMLGGSAELGHMAQVCAAGALSAELVRLDGEPPRYLARYRFSSRQAFEGYEQDHAPALRQDGLQRFPPELGMEYHRELAEVVAIYPQQG